MATNNRYDFIIVGGGNAGLVLAKRLSEGGKFTVCVLEAGDALAADRDDVAMPAMALAVLGKGDGIVWPYVTCPQAQLNGRQVPLPAGRVIGGSTNVNLVVWTRGHATDYDRVAEVTGDPSWTFSALLPYFKKSETYHYPPEPHAVNKALHGDSGPVHVVPFNASGRQFRWRETTMNGYESAGFKWGEDINDGDTLGFGELACSSYFPGGGRQSALTYIAEKPQTLEILGGKTVAKVIFDGTKAVGVTTVGGEMFYARKEVLVCAGGLRSPAILQHSGIGPKELLTSLGIPVVVDSPGVGQNFWDHPILHMRWRVKEAARGGTMEDLRDPERLKAEMELYNSNGTGLLGGVPFEFTAWKNHSNVCRDIINAETSLSESHRKYLASETTPHSQYLLMYGFANTRYANLGPEDSYISISSMLVMPSSRGSIKICSSDPSVLPIFDPQWLTTKTDRALMKAALKTSAEIMEGPAWKEIIEEEVSDRDGTLVGFTDEMLERKINEGAMTTFHYGGTCAMAAPDNEEVIPVVDSKCQVYGVTGLRVVDLSVYPVPISANTQAPTYALAEKIADVILTTYQS